MIIGSTTGTMGTWLEMRNLKWRYKKSASANEEKDILPNDIKNMKKLKTLFLDNYPTSMLPNSVYRFQHLEKQALHRCFGMLELPTLERFPNLRLVSIKGCISLKYLQIGTWRKGNHLSKFRDIASRKTTNLEFGRATIVQELHTNNISITPTQYIKIQ